MFNVDKGQRTYIYIYIYSLSESGDLRHRSTMSGDLTVDFTTLKEGRYYDLAPSQICFGHGSISNRFQDGDRVGERLDDAIDAIERGHQSPLAFPPLGAVKVNGRVVAIQGNSRLFCSPRVGITQCTMVYQKLHDATHCFPN